MRTPAIAVAIVALLSNVSRASDSQSKAVAPRVVVEEDIYSYEPPQNGSGPMWCHGSTCIIRVDDHVFVSGIETIPGAKPLNNCLPTLFTRTDAGWELIHKGEGRTREPCPMAASSDGKAFLSINPTLTEPDTYNGPAEPRILEFAATEPRKDIRIHLPVWEKKPKFSEHSYRSFAADGPNNEMILFQNIGYGHAEWAFRDSDGGWSAQGKLVWPYGHEYDKPQPIRVCYPAVALKDRGVYFCGVSDILEPYNEWREYKKEVTGRDWDYDFRRLFYTWSDDITTGEFHEWVEVSTRDKTCGWIFPSDLYVAPSGDVFVMWSERALDERLRDKFFPDAKQRHSLEYAVIRNGEVVLRKTLVEGGEDLGGERPGDARFQVTEDGRLFVFYTVGGSDEAGKPIADHRLVEIAPNGEHGDPVTIDLQKPISSFFNASIRAGCRPSHILDLLTDAGGTMRYIQIKLW